jgi:cell division protein FtsA
MVRASLDAAGITREAGNRVVLTGGASQLPGARELATQILDRQVRLGRPTAVRGLPDYAQGPAFATAAGLLSWATGGGRHFADLNLDDDSKPTLLRRIINFLVQRL